MDAYVGRQVGRYTRGGSNDGKLRFSRYRSAYFLDRIENLRTLDVEALCSSFAFHIGRRFSRRTFADFFSKKGRFFAFLFLRASRLASSLTVRR